MMAWLIIIKKRAHPGADEGVGAAEGRVALLHAPEVRELDHSPPRNRGDRSLGAPPPLLSGKRPSFDFD